MGIVVLLLNGAFGGQPGLMILALTLGACTAAAVGVFLGVLMKDINSLFAAIKSLGIFLYAPALLYIFPQIPDWIGRIFPTFYVLNPIIEITQNNAGFQEVALDLGIQSLFLAVLVFLIGAFSRRVRLSEA
jgi:ABC-2 type transport system permease protein